MFFIDFFFDVDIKGLDFFSGVSAQKKIKIFFTVYSIIIKLMIFFYPRTTQNKYHFRVV